MTKKYKTALTIMRAQPFHLGHERIINQMLDESETVYVLIGSSQECRTDRNPFTYAERKQMIENVFGQTDRIVIKPIADLGDYSRWANYIVTNLGFTPDAYYCGNDQDRALFAAIGINTVEFDRDILPISATEIRQTKNMKLISPSNIEIVTGVLK